MFQRPTSRRRAGDSEQANPQLLLKPCGRHGDGLRRLSADQVKSIEKNLYSGSSNYLSEDEKSNL